MEALLAFMQAHEHDGVHDAAAMAQLNGVLVPAALAVWPRLQQVLKSKDDFGRAVFNWAPADGFKTPLTREEVSALTQLLMLQVGLPLVSFFFPLFFFFYFILFSSSCFF